VKRRALERHLRDHGCIRAREGSRHVIWLNPATGASATVPRHREVNTYTARGICRDLDIPPPSGR